MEKQTFSLSFQGLSLDMSSDVKYNGDEWIMFLHGIQFNKDLFTDLFKQPFLENYSLLGVDLVGFGKSSKPKIFSYDIADQSIILEQLVHKLSIKKFI